MMFEETTLNGTAEPTAEPIANGSSALMRNLLLDRFPLNEAEVDTLLTLYARYCETSALEEGKETTHCRALEKVLPEMGRIFETAMQTVFVAESAASCDDDADGADQHRAKFLEAAVSLCGRRGGRFLLEALFSATEDGSVKHLASLIYRLCQVCRQIAEQSSLEEERAKDSSPAGTTVPAEQQPPQSWINLFSTIGGADKDTVSRIEWRNWADRCIPTVHQTLSTVFQYYLFGPKCQYRPARFHFPTPCSRELGSLLWNNASETVVPMQLALMDLAGPWRRIFCSEEEGLSFRTFHEALTSFSGSTLILIQTVDGEKLGYYSDVPWKSSPNWYSGEGESFLFRLHPFWNVYHSQFDGLPKKHHQFLNTPVSNRKDSLVGLAIGGVAVDHPRLHITMSLERCKACSIGAVFDSGPLLTNEEDHFFDVDILEVWSVRTDDESFQQAVRKGKVQADVKESRRKSSGTVDRKQFVDDFTSGSFMSNVFAHRDQARGRAEFVADPAGNGYYVEGKRPSIGRLDLENDDNET